MDIMKEFEGFKRINNSLSLRLGEIQQVLLTYADQIGKVSIENNEIVCDTDGKYCIVIKISKNQIILERKADPNQLEEAHTIGESMKSVDMSIADRMLDQIYDLLTDYMENGYITKEHITGVQKVLFVEQLESVLSDTFFINNKEEEKVYEVKNNRLFKEYAINDLISKRQDVKISYKEMENNKFLISKNPYTMIPITKSQIEDKTTFVGTINNKTIKAMGDFTSNHFTIEVNDLVIGAIDSLDDVYKNRYRIEINNLEYEYLVIAINVIIDMYLDIEEEMHID